MSSPRIIFVDQQVLARLRAEYLEMPDLKLRIEQIQHLCGIEQTMCALIVDTLVKAAFLSLKADGTYVRLMEGPPLTSHPAKSALTPARFRTASRRAS